MNLFYWSVFQLYKDRTKAAGEVVSGKRLYLPANDTDVEAIQHYFKTVERDNLQLMIDLPEGVDQVEVICAAFARKSA